MWLLVDDRYGATGDQGDGNADGEYENDDRTGREEDSDGHDRSRDGATQGNPGRS